MPWTCPLHSLGCVHGKDVGAPAGSSSSRPVNKQARVRRSMKPDVTWQHDRVPVAHGFLIFAADWLLAQQACVGLDLGSSVAHSVWASDSFEQPIQVARHQTQVTPPPLKAICSLLTVWTKGTFNFPPAQPSVSRSYLGGPSRAIGGMSCLGLLGIFAPHFRP